MNDTLQHFSFEGGSRILSEDELESFMEIAQQRVARWPNRVLVSALSSNHECTFKLPISGRKVTCPAAILIPMVMAEIDYRRLVDSEWDEDLLASQRARKNRLHIAEC